MLLPSHPENKTRTKPGSRRPYFTETTLGDRPVICLRDYELSNVLLHSQRFCANVKRSKGFRLSFFLRINSNSSYFARLSQG